MLEARLRRSDGVSSKGTTLNNGFDLLRTTISPVRLRSSTISENRCLNSFALTYRRILNHLNIALGSCGEFHSCYESFKQADQITDDEYERLDKLHYKVENELLKLIESLQTKQKDAVWEDNFQPK